MKTQKQLDQMKTLPEFIAYFQSIPANKWCAETLKDDHGRYCARGHLGVLGFMDTTKADRTLRKMAPNIVDHNNGYDAPLSMRHTGIKARVIKYLKGLV